MASLIKIALIGSLMGVWPLIGVAAEDVVIGVLAKRGPERAIEKWSATAEYLSQQIPQYQFEIKPLGFEQIEPAVRSGEIDFILTNSGIYVRLENRYGVNRITTLKNRVGSTSSSRFGGVLFARADSDLHTFHDLRGRSMMAVDPSSLGGFQMVWREMKIHGLDPYEDLSELLFGGTHDAVVYAVLDGTVDMGTVRTDTLERMAHEGKILLENLRVLEHPQQESASDEYHALHSTRYYPEWPFSKLKHTSLVLAERVAMVLMEMPPTSVAAIQSNSTGWTIPLNYQPVHELFRELQLPPYEPKPIGIREFISQHQITAWGVISGFVLVLLVITVLKRSNVNLVHARTKLEKSRDELDSILSSMEEGLVVVDGNNRIRQVNRQLSQWVGVDEETLKGQLVSTIFTSSDEHSHHSPESLIELFGDRLQQVHDTDHDKFHRFLDEAPVPLLVVDITDPDREIQLFLSSQDFSHQLGYEKEELDRVALSHLLSGDDLEHLTQSLREIGREQVISDHYRYHWRSKSGEEFESTANLAQLFCGQENHVLIGVNITSSFPWALVNMTHFGSLFVDQERDALKLLSEDGTKMPVQISTTMLLSDDGAVEGAIMAVHDLRDFLSAESERRANLAKDEFFASMSHELRTPLTAIIGNCEMLGHGEKDPDRQMMIRSIEVSGQSQLSLVNDILDLSKIESGKFTIDDAPYDLSKLIGDMEYMLSVRARDSGLTLTCSQTNDEAYQLIGDRQRIGQILVNLLGNAIKFTPSGGRISLVSRVEGDQLLFSVQDSGIGMSSSVLDRLFQRFEQAEETTSTQYGGTGLGLYVSKMLSELMEGTIEVSSEEGVGSTFELKLPYRRSEQKVAEEIPAGTTQPKEDTKLHGHVLIAEDTPELQLLECRMMEGFGLTVETANDGQEALNLVMNNHFDLVLMDMQMPVMDGLEATREIRKQENDIPIIALTANVLPKHRAAFSEAGCNRFLGKPIDRKEMKRTISQFLKLEADQQMLEQLGVSDRRKVNRRDATSVNDREDAQHKRGRAPRRLQDRADERDSQQSTAVDEFIDDEMRQLFLSRAGELLKELQRGYAAEDWEQVCNTAHTIKGSGASFGYPVLTESGKAVCDAVEEKEMERVPQLAKALIAELSGLSP